MGDLQSPIGPGENRLVDNGHVAAAQFVKSPFDKRAKSYHLAAAAADHNIPPEPLLEFRIEGPDELIDGLGEVRDDH